ncbi:MAG: DoxX family protein [Thermoanaerobaculia bacterium]|nr:DoxX family protein [Thermoanaerobaculia bacterium]
MNRVALIARILLGLVFFVIGLNGFLNFLPAQELPSGPAREYTEGLAAAGYFLPVLKLVETVGGALLLTGFFVPLALILLAPVVVQIFLFHLFLAQDGLPLAGILVVLAIVVAWAHRDSFRSVLVKRAGPSV